MRSDPLGVRDASFYDWAYQAYEDSRSMDSHLRPVWEKALDFAEGSLLDLGCGAGQLARLALDRGMKYQKGVDFSEEAVRLARERCPEAEFICAGIMWWVGSGESDTYVLVEVLEHLVDDTLFMRRLRASQKVVYSVPNVLCSGHTRAFDSLVDVLSRYDMIEPLETATIKHEEKTWWIVKGVRRAS